MQSAMDPQDPPAAGEPTPRPEAPPSFPEAEWLLRRAYNTLATYVIRASTIAGMMPDRRRTPRPASHERRVHLDPMERHAMAAQTVAQVERLPQVERAYVQAMYGRNGAGLNDLVRHAAGVFDRPVAAAGLAKIVLGYLGQGIGDAAIRRDLRCRNAQVAEYRRRVADCLDRVHTRALSLLDERFATLGFYEDCG